MLSNEWVIEHGIAASYIYQSAEPINETEMREKAISHMQGFIEQLEKLTGMKIELLNTYVEVNDGSNHS